ncbi:MAG: hypothetical protein M3494_09655 [Actinomycetota bacterium]|nr:hypothetical protein [Actinomycetota bacterium]
MYPTTCEANVEASQNANPAALEKSGGANSQGANGRSANRGPPLAPENRKPRPDSTPYGIRVNSSELGRRRGREPLAVVRFGSRRPTTETAFGK